ncbi:MAG: NAD(P)/FAD-dependent oxidoreductase [Chloroflexota bacterium]
MAERDKRYVIIGNGVAGTTAAETLRKTDQHCSVTLFGDEPYPLYNRVALPPFIKRRVNQQKVMLRSRETHTDLGITLRLDTRVTAVDTSGGCVTTDQGDVVPYDALLIATGGRPNKLDVPGADRNGIYNFQYLDDALAILQRAETAKRAVAVGGSYIAYELAEAFRHDGLETIWLIRGDRFLRRVLDEDGGALVDDIAREAGVETVYNDAVASVEGDGLEIQGITTQKGRVIQTDMLGIGVGLTMNTDFLDGSGIETRTGVLTNEFLETNVAGVYAAGDIAEFLDLVIGRHNMMGTWGNAAGHGRIVAMNMMGQRTQYYDVPMYSSTLFDSFIRVIGLTPENYPDLESYERLDVHAKSFQRLFFLENRVVGACLIGNSKFRTRIFTLIKSRDEIPVTERARILEE